MISGPTETPSDWMIASTPVSARFTVTISRASPAIFSSWGWSTRILRADRASARTECPALRAAFTVSRPNPLLAPIIRTVATASYSQTHLAHRSCAIYVGAPQVGGRRASGQATNQILSLSFPAACLSGTAPDQLEQAVVGADKPPAVGLKNNGRARPA